MNLTKEQKAGVVYGPDHRLHWTVTTPMPRLLVSRYVHSVYTMYNVHMYKCTNSKVFISHVHIITCTIRGL